MSRRGLTIGVAFILMSAPVWADGIASERRALQSRVQAMGHGYHSAQEWDDVQQRIAQLRERAARTGPLEEVFALTLLEAQIEGDIKGDIPAALQLLQRALARYSEYPSTGIPQLYVQKARLYARLGDEREITRLIRAFETSPHFDPIQYPFVGGHGPDDPLIVTRPRATGRDSITLSTLQRYRAQARMGPGRVFPDLTGTDAAGRTVRISDLRGQVVLVDFWSPGFIAWERQLDLQRAIYRRYRDGGFQIIGIPLGRDVNRTRAAVQRLSLEWPQWTVPPRALAEVGVFGDAMNILLDRNGVVVARQIRGADLDAALDALIGQ